MISAGSGGLFLLLTESYVVRALLGSLAAVGLVTLAVRSGRVHSGRGRRLLVLAPMSTALVVAAVSVGDAFLPRLWVTSSTAAGGQLLDLLGESWALVPQGRVDVLLLAWATVAVLLLARRLGGVVAVRRLLRQATPPLGYGDLVPVVERINARLGLRRSPALLLLPRCPGGAFTARVRRPVVVVDPAVVDELDQRELEGLLAHELAHIRRRDNLLAGATGLVRDVLFFLPPVHLASRWLHREREESADELASAITQRPGALASSILKVWEQSVATRRPVACAAGPTRRAVAGGGAVVGARVERLLAPPEGLAPWRRRAEVGVAGAVTAAAIGAALGVPTWVVQHYDAAGLAVGYLSPAPSEAEPVEAPALATFRHLAPSPGVRSSAVPAALSGTVGGTAVEGRGPAAADVGRPVIPSQTELRDRRAPDAGVGDPGLRWEGEASRPWELRSVEQAGRTRSARPLWTIEDPGQHAGLFLLGSVAQR
ncbi:MAG: M56 family metallopeptidase [Egibacteraceae bacterium]